MSASAFQLRMPCQHRFDAVAKRTKTPFRVPAHEHSQIGDKRRSSNTEKEEGA